MKNYRAINDNVAAIVTMTATVEDVCLRSVVRFIFVKRLLRNLTRHFQRWLSAFENKCGLSNLSDYIAGS